MNYNVIPTEKFKKQSKKLVRKYPSLKTELLTLSNILSKNPRYGTDLGNNTYKIRIAIKSKGKGKSGGARIISFVVSKDNEIYLLTIYDKSEIDNISDGQIKEIIKEIPSSE